MILLKFDQLSRFKGADPLLILQLLWNCLFSISLSIIGTVSLLSIEFVPRNSNLFHNEILGFGLVVSSQDSNPDLGSQRSRYVWTFWSSVNEWRRWGVHAKDFDKSFPVYRFAALFTSPWRPILIETDSIIINKRVFTTYQREYLFERTEGDINNS